jgi:hypothetical protein
LEGIRGETHRIDVSYLFENITISWIPVRQTAKVAGFWGMINDGPREEIQAAAVF